MSTVIGLSEDAEVVQRIFDHIDHRTTDVSEASWREPVANYRCPDRLGSEIERVLRRQSIPFCPSVALPQAGSFLARDAAGTPILAVRAADGKVRAFRNACRHRGTQLATGAGCQKSLVCSYHGWTYGLDGSLRHIPHEHGFPAIDKQNRGLMPIFTCEEHHGMVFVNQDGPASTEPRMGGIPELIPSAQRLIHTATDEIAANWKILAEGFLEGYHLRTTHRDTFYPAQFDNLTLIESFGCNSRISFPYRAIGKLRSVPPEKRRATGVLTYLYHLFPNVMIATFPNFLAMVVLEPLGIERTNIITYTLTDLDLEDDVQREQLKQAEDFAAAGLAEDRAVACSIQRGLASGANEFLEFARFEGAIAHFHRNLHAELVPPPAITSTV